MPFKKQCSRIMEKYPNLQAFIIFQTIFFSAVNS